MMPQATDAGKLEFPALLMDALPDGVLMRASHGELLGVNSAFCRMTGYGREELIGQRPPNAFWPPEHRAEIQRTFDAYMAGAIGERELVFSRKNGERFPVTISISAIRDERGERAGALVTVRDATGHRAAMSAAAIATQERQRLLLEAMPQIVWTSRPDGAWDYLNQRWVDYTGCAAEQSVGLAWQAMVHSEDRQHALEEWSAAVRQSKPYESEFRIRSRDGSYRWHLGRGVPIRDGAREILFWIGTCTDIDVHKRHEQSLRAHAGELATMARQLQRKNEELDQFAYITSHDLKAPLRGIINLSEWIEEDLAPTFTPEARQQMELLRGRVRRMEKLIDGILQLSRVGRVRSNLEPVDVSVLLREIIDLLHPPEGFSVEVGSGMPRMVTDKLRLEQVFMNLIGNAIKHHGGPPARIRISAAEREAMYEFAVADDGPGIAPQYHERIFAIFQTLAPRDKVEGTGLGLSLVKKIVEAHGGSIQVESQEGAGATFRFTWPREPRGTAQ